jgi:hypothetical protein
VRESVTDCQAAKECAQALEQKKRDLDAARHLAEKVQNTLIAAKSKSTTSAGVLPVPTNASADMSQPVTEQEINLPEHQDELKSLKSPPEQEWGRQKRVDGVSNDAIDALMGLTGLNDAKEQVLRIKAKIGTVLRQGTDMKSEQLGIVLIGNPGTVMRPGW